MVSSVRRSCGQFAVSATSSPEVFNGPTWFQYSTKRFTGWVTDKEPVMNPENHDNNRMRLVHLLRLKPVE